MFFQARVMLLYLSLYEDIEKIIIHYFKSLFTSSMGTSEKLSFICC